MKIEINRRSSHVVNSIMTINTPNKIELSPNSLIHTFILRFTGYFVDHIYAPSDATGNDTVTAREKSRLNVNSISTYVGPMIMGVGGK